MYALGLDMSLTGTGIVRLVLSAETNTWDVDAHTTISTKPTVNLYDRCSLITEAVMNSLRPNMVVAVEDYAISKFSATTMITLGAILRWNLRAHSVSYWLVSPTSVKKFASGNGKAEKDAMMMNVLARWGFKSPNNNEADAYAIARAAIVLGGHNVEGKKKNDEVALGKATFVDNSQ